MEDERTDNNLRTIEFCVLAGLAWYSGGLAVGAAPREQRQSRKKVNNEAQTQGWFIENIGVFFRTSLASSKKLNKLGNVVIAVATISRDLPPQEIFSDQSWW
jgi:hypothetical protein